jgi:hypothetical protein
MVTIGAAAARNRSSKIITVQPSKGIAAKLARKLRWWRAPAVRGEPRATTPSKARPLRYLVADEAIH